MAAAAQPAPQRACCRRLVRDYEIRLDVSNAMIHLGMAALLPRRVSAPARSQS